MRIQLNHDIPSSRIPKELIAKTTREVFHAERTSKGGLKFVSDGIEDIQKNIDSQKCNAGLQNILKLQTLRYGTIENAVARNKDKQVFADVSKVPDSVGEQAAFVAATENELDALARKYGCTKEQILNCKTSDELSALFAPKTTEVSSGGNE